MKSQIEYPEVEAPLLPTWFAGKTKEFTEFGVTCTITCSKSDCGVPAYPLDWNGVCVICGHGFTQEFMLEPQGRHISEFIATSILKVLAIGAATLTEVKS
jgi:hypothetical protein